MTWRKVKLGDICEFKYGKSLVKEKRVTEGPYPVYGSSGIVGYHDEYIVEGPCLIVGRKGSIGSIFLSEVPCYPIDTAYYVKCKEDINIKFLFYQLTTLRLNKLNKAAAVPGLNRDDAYEKSIIVPPLNVQQQIADTLDKADALCRKDQELLQKYDDLAQSIFYDMFGDPERNEMGWTTSRLGDLLLSIKSGTSLGGDERELQQGEYGVLKISAVTSGSFKPDEFKVPPQDAITKEKVTVQAGDLLFSRANTRELVGAVAIADASYPYLMLPDKLWRLDLDSDRLRSHYCKAVLTDRGIRYNLTKTATGTSGSMLNISMAKLKALEVPVPPVELQNAFEAASEQVLLQKRAALQAAQHSETLITSLLHSYFKS